LEKSIEAFLSLIFETEKNFNVGEWFQN
jgi:hypothetical protein